jgi:hypothetical protein
MNTSAKTNQFLIGLIVLLSIGILILAMSYRGERKTNRESKKEKREYLRALDSLAVESNYHAVDAARSRDLIRKSEAEKIGLIHAAEKREAVLNSKIKNLTKAQAAALIPKDTLLAGELILKGMAYDSLKKDYDRLSTLMTFREIEFKNVIANQDSLIMNLKYEVQLRESRMTDLEDQIKIFKKQKRARAWQRNIAIVGGIGLVLLLK